MNRAEMKEKLDVDKNGKVNFEDVVALAGNSDGKLFAMGIGVGVVIGLILGVAFF